MIEVLRIVIEFRDEAQQLAIVAVTAAAFLRGGGPERASALALLYLLVADIAYHAAFGPGVALNRMDVGHAVIDATAAVAMLAIGAAANRMYTLWIGALQIIAVEAHLARLVATDLSPLAYAIMYTAPSYLQIALLAGGTWNHHRRQRVYGSYRPWRISSPPSPEIAPLR